MGIAEPRSTRYELDGPERFVLWASRHYLWSAIRGTAAPDFVYDAFENAGIDFLYYSLDRVLVCLLAAPTRAITVHDVRCHCLAEHEQCLLDALARLQRNDGAGFSTSMSAIMLPSAVKVAEPALKLLAAGMMRLKPEQLSWLERAKEVRDDTLRVPDHGCYNRTIN